MYHKWFVFLNKKKKKNNNKGMFGTNNLKLANHFTLKKLMDYYDSNYAS